MKRMLLLFIVITMLVGLLSVTVTASEDRPLIGYSSIEYLENGDYIVTEFAVTQPGSLFSDSTMTTRSGSRTKNYYNSDGTKIWSLTVNGTFSYTYGVSSTATSATATVNIFSSNASFVSKSAYTSGNTATATGTVAYNSVTKTMTVSVSCDKYGNLS